MSEKKKGGVSTPAEALAKAFVIAKKNSKRIKVV